MILKVGRVESGCGNGRDGIFWSHGTSAEDRVVRRNGGCDKTGAVHVVAGNATGDRHDDAHPPARSRNGPAAWRSQATFEG